jgi:5-methylcytosine-specific restriction endonuclease McrA
MNRPESKRKNRHRFLRWWLLQISEAACWYCGWPLTLDSSTLDHVQPRSRGGRTEEKNVRLACRVCNGIKGDRPLEQITVRPRRGAGVLRARRDVA